MHFESEALTKRHGDRVIRRLPDLKAILEAQGPTAQRPRTQAQLRTELLMLGAHLGIKVRKVRRKKKRTG